METITEDYCSFEVSKLLKDKGFDAECRAAYTNYGKLFTTQIQQYITNILCSKGTLWDCIAPTHQMAIKWLREEYNIIFVFKPASFSGENCTFWTYELWCGDNFEGEILSFKTYEEAVEAALKYSLENLI